MKSWFEILCMKGDPISYGLCSGLEKLLMESRITLLRYRRAASCPHPQYSPMGLPADVNVIAWDLSLERPTMILYNIDNIRELFGHKVDLEKVKSNPICRVDL